MHKRCAVAMPMTGEELCFVGVGLRSNMEAVNYIMEQDLFGTHRVAVVYDRFDHNQDRMHLDCVFNILGRKVCLMFEGVIGNDSPIKRLGPSVRAARPTSRPPSDVRVVLLPVISRALALANGSTVDEYEQEYVDGRLVYRRVRTDIEFAQYMSELGWAIIPINKDQQLAYGCNVLNLGDGNIVSVHEPTARVIAQNEAFRGRIRAIPFSSITHMYGAVHCATQVVRRRMVAPASPPRPVRDALLLLKQRRHENNRSTNKLV